MQRGLGKIGCSDALLSNMNPSSTLPGGSLRLDPQFVFAEKNEQPSLSSGMLHHDSHEPLDQLGKEDLARERL